MMFAGGGSMRVNTGMSDISIPETTAVDKKKNRHIVEPAIFDLAMMPFKRDTVIGFSWGVIFQQGRAVVVRVFR
jgi:hypothetical protein